MKLKILTIYFIIHYSQQLALPIAAATSVSSAYGLQGQCKGIRPLYDNQGNLIGYKGSCDVDKWNGSLSSVNSLHPIDPNLMALNHENLIAGPNDKIKYEQPKNASLFDWLSPHHDIIRNHPHYRHAHLNHGHCIRKAKTGLFDFLGSLFNYGTDRKNYNQFGTLNDPYSGLDQGTRCLNSQYYNNYPLDIEKKYYDPYALQLAHQIHHIRNQVNTNENSNNEFLKKHLRKRYRQLHRHLDCHCHHESAQSKLLNIHHHPIEGHSMNIIAHPMAGSATRSLQLHSSIPLDENMDMENEHMALLRMSNLAAQRAYDMNYFNDESLAGNGALRMEMFHPVNPYMNNSGNYDPEWNRLRVEKVIVIKRIKVPVVTKVSVPIPVPVPYPMPTSSNVVANGDSQYQNYDENDTSAQFNNIQPQFLGNNTYMIDSAESQPEQMTSIVRAISGAPCESFEQEQSYINSPYIPPMNQVINRSYNYNPPTNHCNMINGSNMAMSTHTAIQPGLQLYPAPFASGQPQYSKPYQYGSIHTIQPQPINLQPQLQSNTQFIPSVTAAVTQPQNLIQGPILTNSNY